MAPILNQLSDHCIVVSVFDRIAQPLGHILCSGKFRTRNHFTTQKILRHHLATIDLLIEEARQRENLDLVKIGDWSHCTADISVKRGITQRHLGLVTVAGENQSVLCSQARKHIGKANSRLNIFIDQPGVLARTSTKLRTLH